MLNRRQFTARLLSSLTVLAVSRRLMPPPPDAASKAGAEAAADQVAATIRRMVEEAEPGPRIHYPISATNRLARLSLPAELLP